MKIKKDPVIISAPDPAFELPETVKKYLTKYNTDNHWTVEADNTGFINNVVVVPAICEFNNIKSLLTSLTVIDNDYFKTTLFLFVINNSTDHCDEIKTDNKNSLQLLRNIIFKNTGDKFIEDIIKSGLRIAVIDASTEGNELPENNAGAGLARKIGMDLALTVFNYKTSSKKILICLDADCSVEKNYLTEIVENFNNRNISAAVIKYSHSESGDPDTERAITCYEIFLNYYELGLKLALSPYAFHSIGSTIACDYESYIKVEGMNKKKAGEDFYFLEKLIKNVKVEKIITTVVHPAPRISWRVPFGTGPRISRFLNNVQNEYLLYNPISFFILRDWLEVFLYGDDLTADEYLKKAGLIDNTLHNFLRSQKFGESWNKISANSSGIEQRQKQKILWFDGFRTLKLIHYLRDNEYNQINMFDALDKILGELKIDFPARKGKMIPDIRIQKEYLNILKTSIENLN